MCLWLHLRYNRRMMFIRDRCSANVRWWVARGLLFGALPHVSIQKHVVVERFRTEGALLTRRIMPLLMTVISGIYVETLRARGALISM